MISMKIVSEFSIIKGQSISTIIDMLPKKNSRRRFLTSDGKNPPQNMLDNLHDALKAMTIEEDEPITLTNGPRFKVFEYSSLSILGSLLNPNCQAMSRMIEDMPCHWKVYERVRGIALSKDKFQFIFEREEDLQRVLRERPCSFNNWMMVIERWTATPPDDFLTRFELWICIRNIPYMYYTAETMNELAKAVGIMS